MVCVLQLITQQGITAGLEADQAAKLAHIDVLKSEMTATKTALRKQEELTRAAESALEAAQAELSQRDTVIAGQSTVCKLTIGEFSDVACLAHYLVQLGFLHVECVSMCSRVFWVNSISCRYHTCAGHAGQCIRVHTLVLV